MSFIESVVVEGFWGDRRIEFDFYEDVNFIIGINGSGKTTAVDLIVSALTADYIALDRIDFTKLTIRLKSFESKKKPSITITKISTSKKPFPSIEYAIQLSASEKPKKFDIDDFDEQMHLRRYSRNYSREYYQRELFSNETRGITELLDKLISVSWLSVHRAEYESYDHDEGNYISSVDKKLKEQSNRLVRYFSILNREGSELLEAFQKQIFLSLLFKKSAKGGLFRTVDKIDLGAEKRALEGVFSQFNVPLTDYKKKLDSHFELLAKAKEKLEAPEDKSLNITDIAVLSGVERIETIVEEWDILLAARNKIFEPKDTFLKIINAMMQRKTFTINAQNEFDITTQSGKVMEISHLSSGEKQLLIVLSEALLQEKKSWVYIADEPELSLHVIWQESLVGNLRSINPNAQIIFATHSPDVVSHFNDKVFNMEDVLS